MDAEALRVVKMMPRWIPAEVGGRPVASHYVLPVRYIAEEDNTSIFVLPDDNRSANSSGNTETETVISVKEGSNDMSISVTPDKKNSSEFIVYVDGKKFEGNLNDIPSSKIESMSVDKTEGATPIIRITLKK